MTQDNDTNISRMMALKPGDSLAYAIRLKTIKPGAVQAARDRLKNRLAGVVNIAKKRGVALTMDTQAALTHDGTAVLVVAVVTRTKGADL